MTTYNVNNMIQMFMDKIGKTSGNKDLAEEMNSLEYFNKEKQNVHPLKLTDYEQKIKNAVTNVKNYNFVHDATIKWTGTRKTIYWNKHINVIDNAGNYVIIPSTLQKNTVRIVSKGQTLLKDYTGEIFVPNNHGLYYSLEESKNILLSKVYPDITNILCQNIQIYTGNGSTDTHMYNIRGKDYSKIPYIGQVYDGKLPFIVTEKEHIAIPKNTNVLFLYSRKIPSERSNKSTNFFGIAEKELLSTCESFKNISPEEMRINLEDLMSEIDNISIKIDELEVSSKKLLKLNKKPEQIIKTKLAIEELKTKRTQLITMFNEQKAQYKELEDSDSDSSIDYQLPEKTLLLDDVSTDSSNITNSDDDGYTSSNDDDSSIDENVANWEVSSTLPKGKVAISYIVLYSNTTKPEHVTKIKELLKSIAKIKKTLLSTIQIKNKKIPRFHLISNDSPLPDQFLLLAINFRNRIKITINNTIGNVDQDINSSIETFDQHRKSAIFKSKSGRAWQVFPKQKGKYKIANL